MPYWMRFTQDTNKEKLADSLFDVRYSTPTLGFTVHEKVDEKTHRMLQIAVEVGREQMKAEIHDLLRMK